MQFLWLRLIRLFGQILDGYRIPELYKTQFTNPWEQMPIIERLKRDGELQEQLTGGSILHINIDKGVKGEQAKYLIDLAIKHNCGHFAVNATYGECKCGHNFLGKEKSCPRCGGTSITFFTRVIGYLSPVVNWSHIKQEFDFKNRVQSQMPIQ